MCLCDWDIEVWFDEGCLLINLCLLVECINGVMVDVCLGNKFCIFCGYMVVFIDLSGFKDEVSVVFDCVMSDEIVFDESEVFYFYLGELVLVVMLELVMLLVDLVGWLDGCFFLVCLGLMVHVIVHCIDLGWFGCIVLEFYNFGKLLLVLCLGMLIGVLSFELFFGLVVWFYNCCEDVKYCN